LSGEQAFAREKSGKVILTFLSDEEGGGEWIEGEGRLSSLISVRSELARGDIRCLYLGWLLCAQSGELDDEEVEPPVPTGLGQLSASLESLVEFLRIDTDLLFVAARVSQPLVDARGKQEEIHGGSKLPSEKDDIPRLISGEDLAPATELNDDLSGYDRESGCNRTARREPWANFSVSRKACSGTPGLLPRAAEEKARREREAAILRAKHLDKIAGREPELWNEVENLISTKQPKSYDSAVGLLVDLRDLAARKGKTNEFQARLDAIRVAHVRKPSFIERLRKAGL
jgi:hypothetical protein